MDFAELAKARQSERAYLDKPVDRKLIEICMEAARMAPSSCNAEPWSAVIIDDPELKNKVAKTATIPPSSFNKFVAGAPVIIALILERDKVDSAVGARIRKISFPLIDIGAFTENFCLQAAELGLGTCIIGWVVEKDLRKLLNIPKGKRIPLLITVGYPKNPGVRKKVRKPLEEICKYNSYTFRHS